MTEYDNVEVVEPIRKVKEIKGLKNIRLNTHNARRDLKRVMKLYGASDACVDTAELCYEDMMDIELGRKNYASCTYKLSNWFGDVVKMKKSATGGRPVYTLVSVHDSCSC